MSTSWTFDGVTVTWREAFDLYYTDLFELARKLTGDRHDARIIVIEAFTELWVHRDAINDHEHIGFYLFATVENSCLKLRRKKTMHSIDDQPLFIQPEILDAYEQEAAEVRLNKAIDRLPPKQKQVVILLKQKWTIEAIAEEMDITVSNARTLKSRALDRLMELLKHEDVKTIILLLTAWGFYAL